MLPLDIPLYMRALVGMQRAQLTLFLAFEYISVVIESQSIIAVTSTIFEDTFGSIATDEV